MPKVKVNGVELYYEEQGQGEPLVLLAGFASNSTQWAMVSPELAKHYRLLLVDNRGAGRSESPDIAYSVEDMAEDVAALLGHLKIERAHVVGHSMGGAMAQILAARHPQRVNRLVMSNSPARLRPAAAAFFRWMLKLRKSGMAIETLTEGIMPWMFSNDFLSDAETVEAAAKLSAMSPYLQDLTGHIRQLDALMGFEAKAWRGKITAPTLLLASEEDLCTPLADVEELMTGNPDAELHVFPEMGHLPLVEVPEDFARVVLEFLGRK